MDFLNENAERLAFERSIASVFPETNLTPKGCSTERWCVIPKDPTMIIIVGPIGAAEDGHAPTRVISPADIRDIRIDWSVRPSGDVSATVCAMTWDQDRVRLARILTTQYKDAEVAKAFQEWCLAWGTMITTIRNYHMLRIGR